MQRAAVEFGDIDDEKGAVAEVPQTEITPDEPVVETSEAVAEDVPATQEDTGQQDVSEGPQFDEDYLARTGISQEDAARHFRGQDDLENAVLWQDGQAMASGRAYLHQQEQAWQAQQQHAAWQQQQGQQVPQQKPAEAFKLDLNEEEWGADTVQLLNRMHEHYTGRISESLARAERLERVIGGMHQQAQQQQADSWLDAYDGWCNDLPQEYRELFGQGNRHTLRPDSKEFQARQQLNRAAQAMSSGRQVQGLPTLSQEQLLHRVLLSEFPLQREQAVRNDVSQKLVSRFSQSTARPTSRRSSQLTPEMAAAKRVGDFFKKTGVESTESVDEPDGL